MMLIYFTSVLLIWLILYGFDWLVGTPRLLTAYLLGLILASAIVIWQKVFVKINYHLYWACMIFITLFILIWYTILAFRFDCLTNETYNSKTDNKWAILISLLGSLIVTTGILIIS